MPFPFLIAAIIGVKALKTGLDISGNEKQARLFRAEGEDEATLFGKNAELADEQAADALARGQEAVVQQRARMRGLSGEQVAAFGASGTTVGVGSGARASASDFHLGESDTAVIERNAAREALGYKKEAEIDRYRGDMARRAGQNRARATRALSWGSLTNFGGDLLGMYNSGGFGRTK